MNEIEKEADSKVYANCMEEIKLRTKAVHTILNGLYSTPYPITNIEFVCLQIRKILELIALASMASHKEVFAREHIKFAKFWRAKKILDDLEKLNPRFYPVPTEQILDAKTGKVLETRVITKPYLTKNDFVEVYQQCSNILHAENPYGPPKQLDQVSASFSLWMEKIKQLLNHHQVQLYNSKYQLWVVMNAKTDGRVHAWLFEKIDDPEQIAKLHRGRMKSKTISR